MIIDGKSIAKGWKQDIAAQLRTITPYQPAPHLAVVSAGSDPASQVYIQNKKKACEETGIRFTHVQLPEDVSQSRLEQELFLLSTSPDVTGVLLQLPLPDHLSAKGAIEHIAPNRDADGLTPDSAASLLSGDPARIIPCTPLGVLALLECAMPDRISPANHIFDLSGLHAVIVGRSQLVGKPLAHLLLEKNATVTVCHSRTKDLASFTRSADIIVAAAGSPGLITADMVKPGAVVIDVGINRVHGKLCGDVDFEPVSKVASAITPVPGGVGPMTVAALMHNMLQLTISGGKPS